MPSRANSSAIPPNKDSALRSFKPRQQHQRPQVRAQLEQVLRRDLPDHHRFGHPLPAEPLDHAAELADPEPLDGIDHLRRARGPSRHGMPPRRAAPRRTSPAPRARNGRIDSVAGDDPDRLARLPSRRRFNTRRRVEENRNLPPRAHLAKRPPAATLGRNQPPPAMYERSCIPDVPASSSPPSSACSSRWSCSSSSRRGCARASRWHPSRWAA